MSACPTCQLELPGEAPCPRCAPAASPAPDASPTQRSGAAGGTWCGPYRLLGELGRGGTGVVWRAWDPRHEREVALKLLTSLSAEARARFAREAQVLQRLQHPGLVPLLDSGLVGDRPYLAMSLVRGRPLVELTRSGLLDVREAARVIRDAAQAVEHAHARGVLHRDLKPHNLLVDEAGQVKVLDFGVARLADGEALTRTGAVIGSVAFMPPEQLDSRRGPVDARSDVWALGATLHAALTGSSPFSDAAQLSEAILQQPAPPASARRRGVPPGLDAIALRCLEKDPRRRYQTAGELADDLHRFLRGIRPLALGPKPRRWTGALGLLLAVVGGAAVTALALGQPGAEGPASPGGEVAAPDTARAAAAAVISRAALAPEATPAEDAPLLAELARLGPGAAPALLDCLEAVAASEEQVVERELMAVATPTPEEAAEGWDPLPGAAEVLARERARQLWASLRPDEIDVLVALRQRRRARVLQEPGRPSLEEVLARAQAAEAPGLLRASRVAVAALERLGIPGAREALIRLLRAEQDPQRAVPVALALLRCAATGDAEALELVEEVAARWRSAGGEWAARVQPELHAHLEQLPPAPGCEDLLRRAKRRMRAGDVRGALEDVLVATADPAVPGDAFSLRANLRLLTGDSRGALEDADRSLARSPDKASLWSNRGVLRLQARDHAGALNDFSSALERGHEDPAEILRHRALVREAQKDLAGMEADLRQALQLRPRFGSAWQELGQLLVARGDQAGAEEAFTRVIAGDPLRSTALLARSRCRAKQRRLEEALADARRCVQIEPRAGVAWLQVAAVQQELDDDAGVSAALDEGIAVEPDMGRLWLARGAQRKQLGDLEGARADLRRARQLDGDNEWGRAAARLLRELGE